jgi:hypothetical protein
VKRRSGFFRRPGRPGIAPGKPGLQPLERETPRSLPYDQLAAQRGASGSCPAPATISENDAAVSLPRLERSTTRPASTETSAQNPSHFEEEHNRSHKQVRARAEHVFAHMKTWKILRDCRLKGDGVNHAILGVARLHNIALTG